MQPGTTSTAKAALKSINVFFYAMVGGMLMFTILIFALNLLEKPAMVDESMVNIFLVVVLLVAAISLIVATRMYPKRIAAAHATGLSLIDKLNIYRGALVLYMALCEGPGLFAVIVYFLTGNKLLLIVVAVVLLAMLLKRPEKSKIFNELQLSSREQLELN